MLHRWLGGYLAYSKGLEDPGTKHTRWIQKDVELGALWTFAAWRTPRTFVGLTLGLGGIHSWLRSGSTMDYEPLLLVLGSGGGSCSEPVSGTALSSCSSGATFEGTGWGFTPSVLGTFGAADGIFLGLRFAGRYLWVEGTNTPSSVREHEVLFVVGWSVR